jgi:protoporphyrinogen oxidase
MSASLELKRRNVDFSLIERESFVGGLAITREEAGYRFDCTGHLLHLRDATRRDRILGMLDEPPLLVQRESFIHSENVLTRYPYQSNTFGLPADVAYECVLGFVQAFYRDPKPLASNFEEYCRIHFGDAISERFMLPYNGRLWGVEPREITTEWCDRFVPLPSVEDVLAGAVGKRRNELGYNATGYYPRRGIGELTAAMGRQLPHLHTHLPVRRIDPRARRCDFDSTSTRYQTLISTLPLTTLLSLIDGIPAEVAELGQRLRCSSLYYLDVALKRFPKPFFHWIYVPESRHPFYRVGNYAAFSKEMAPNGSANLYIELAERTPPDLTRLWPDVVRSLLEMSLIGSTDDIDFYRLRRIDHAYVIYDQHRTAHLGRIIEYLASIGIVSTGRYGGWNYSSMEDALRFGEEAVTMALGCLS